MVDARAWIERLDVMARSQCVELSAKEAGQLRDVLEAMEAACIADAWLHEAILPNLMAEESPLLRGPEDRAKVASKSQRKEHRHEQSRKPQRRTQGRK